MNYKNVYSYGEVAIRFNFKRGTKEYTSVYFYTEHKDQKNIWIHWFTEKAKE